MPTQSPAVLEVYPAYVCHVDCTLELIYIHNDSQYRNVFICYFFNTYMCIMHAAKKFKPFFIHLTLSTHFEFLPWLIFFFSFPILFNDSIQITEDMQLNFAFILNITLHGREHTEYGYIVTGHELQNQDLAGSLVSVTVTHPTQPHPLLHYLASPVCCEFEYIAQL